MSEQPKWTPGPWHVWDRGIGWEVHVGEICRDHECASINEEFRDTFTEADARLIAAAPELYEALAGLLIGHPSGDSPEQKIGRAALAKARGEA